MRASLLNGVGRGGVGIRPRDEGAPYTEYFAALNRELKARGPMHPCLIVDLDRLDHNLAEVSASIAKAPGRSLRIVEKSLPCAALLDYAMKKLGTNRLMSFHRPFLSQSAATFPDSDILLGKPLPTRAAEAFFREHKGAFDPERQLQWLIDTPQRLRDYLALAKSIGTRLRINVEIDVGLHRGGVADDAALDAILELIARHADCLGFSGFMGYDPHVVKLPSVFGSPPHLLQQAMSRYARFVDFVRRRYPALSRDELTLNGAGSGTYLLHEAESLTTELSVGSALLKPTDFDVPTLSRHRPACFIAAPVLKVENRPLQLPGLERAVAWLARWDVNQSCAYFIYGGNWMATYESPAGLRCNEQYGRSSNQEAVMASPSTRFGVDDHVFLRPHQSEAVLLQFGDVFTVRAGQIVDRLPVMTG